VVAGRLAGSARGQGDDAEWIDSNHIAVQRQIGFGDYPSGTFIREVPDGKPLPFAQLRPRLESQAATASFWLLMNALHGFEGEA
jgi:hypothetical protein